MTYFKEEKKRNCLRWNVKKKHIKLNTYKEMLIFYTVEFNKIGLNFFQRLKRQINIIYGSKLQKRLSEGFFLELQHNLKYRIL